MRLEYYMPSEPFRDQLTVHAAVEDVGVLVTETLPAMLPNLYLCLHGRLGFQKQDGHIETAPRLSLLGATDRAYKLILEPGLQLMNTGFLPKGWQSLIGLPSAELANEVIDGDDVWGHAAVNRLIEKLQEIDCEVQRCRVLENFLLENAQHRSVRSPVALQIIDHWLEHAPTLCLDQLWTDIGVSQRQLRRLTLDKYGVSPKTLAMKYRSLRVAANLAWRGESVVREAADLFADQSHLIRDFKRFVGLTPLRFARERSSTAANTFAGRLRAGASRPLSLLS